MGIGAITYNNKTYDFDSLTHDDAYYLLQHREEAGLNTAQTKRAESLLSEDELNYIFESDNESNARGKEQMSLDIDGDGKDDIKKNEDGSTDTGEGGGSSGAQAGAIAGAIGALGTTISMIISAVNSTDKLAKINGFVAVVAAGIAIAGAAVALVCSFANIFDKAYEVRKSFSDKSGDLNNQLDAQNNMLVENMDYMNEDIALYEEQSEEYTEASSGASADMAELQIQLADAQAAGDVDLISQTQEKIASLGEEDFSDMEDAMQETRDHLDAYSSTAEEGRGMSTNATTISAFLQTGNQLKEIANRSAIMLAAGALVCTVCAVIAAIPRLPFTIDGFSAAAAGITYGIGAALFGTATGKMFNNAKEQGEFGKNGDTMRKHTEELNSMIDEHQGYMETTVGEFDKLDEESEETQAENAQTSTDAVTEKTGETGSVRIGGHKDKDENHNGIPDEEENNADGGRKHKGGLVGTGPKKPA